MINTQNIYPTTSSQKRLWFVEQLGGPSYNMSQAYRLKGQLDQGALLASINSIIKRHSVLRTIFTTVDEDLFQIVKERLEIELPYLELGSEENPLSQEKIQALIDLEFKKPFKLSSGPLIRANLFLVDKNDFILVIVIHHTIFDRRSDGLFNRELSILYNSFINDTSPSLPTLTNQYSDYALWKNNKEKSEQMKKALQYWTNKLTDSLPLELPYDNKRSTSLNSRGNRLYLDLNADVVSKIEKIANNMGATLYMGLLAAFNLLIFLWSGKSDIAVGTPFADRRMKGADSLLGFFVNTIIIRNNLSEEISFEELLNNVKKTCFSAFRYNGLPFENLVEALKPERQINRNPLFDIEFAYQKAHPQTLQLDGLQSAMLTASKSSAQYDLTLTVREKPEGYDVRIEYRTDIFEQQSIENLLERYKSLLGQITNNSRNQLCDFYIADLPVEKKRIERWNKTHLRYAENLCIHQLFDRQAKISSEKIAVIDEDMEINYRQLSERSNQLAHYLGKHGVGPNSLVAICVERNIEMLISLLAILKAGAAYLPLDKAYPTARLEHMFEDSKTTLLLTDSNTLEQLPKTQIKSILLDSHSKEINLCSTEEYISAVTPEDTAYIIYTSGSTGKPKGVQVRHNNVTNFLASMALTPGISSTDVLVAITTLSFDIAVLELYLPLVEGATLVIASRETATDGNKLRQLLESSKATMMQATPVSWKLLIDSGWQGGSNFTALCGGEAFPRPLVPKLLERVNHLWNMYGPTETTVWSTCYEIVSPSAPVLIGKPIHNTQLHILDKQLRPVAVGTPGELFIGGDGVTKGYLDRPQLNSERFIADPYHHKDKFKLYRTGDLVKQNNDGNLEYLGRLDNQIKLRGNRIELGEIELALQSYKFIAEVIVKIGADRFDSPCLIGYYTTLHSAFIDIMDVRKHLRSTLPNNMIPQHFIELSTIPLTPNGKVDTNKLPQPATESQQSAQNFMAPRTTLEKQLADIWIEVLGLDRVSIFDNFIELGGHSLLALQVISRIKSELKLDVTPLSIIMDTLEQITANIDGVYDKNSSPQTRENNKTNIKPFYFSSNDNQLLGVYHPPKSNDIHKSAVLICYPLYLEALNAHWFFKRMATQLSNEGFHVLRFDYYATGDSEGGDGKGDVNQWTKDIEVAADNLLQLSSKTSISIVGHRFGATMASLIKTIQIENLILWDPVIDGKDYLNELEITDAKEISRFNKDRPDKIRPSRNELLGFPISNHNLKLLASTNLSNSFESNVEQISLLVSRYCENFEQLKSTLSKANQQVTYRVVEDVDGRIERYRELSVFLPSNILRAIVSVLLRRIK